MEKRGAWRTICLALLHTVLAAAIWYLIRQGGVREPDGKLSTLFLVISAVAALGMDALAFILLFFRSRSLMGKGQQVGALVFLLVHSMFLAGLWWMEAAGKIRSADGSVDMTKLVLLIAAVLILDAVVLLLLFPAKQRGSAAQPEKKQQGSPAAQVPASPKIPTVFNTPPKPERPEKAAVEQGKPCETPPSPPEETPILNKSPFDRLDAFENDLRGPAHPERPVEGSGAATPVKKKEEQPVTRKQAKTDKPVFDDSDAKATVFDDSGAKATVFDDGGTKATVLDDAPAAKATVFEAASGSRDTIIDVSQEVTPNGENGLQWAPRDKDRHLPKEEGSVLPDITQLIPREERAVRQGPDKGVDGILVYSEGSMNLRIDLKEGETRLGSKRAKVDYVLYSEHISRLHAVFTRRGREFFVRDAHSTNGTFLNGSETPIPSDVNVPIHNGDSITLADMTFRFYVRKPESED